ncbi:Terpenoid cyclases/protein prenyltransferase alpha-alpha toroid [Parasponia andersonii]|uniref:Terpenoid cyclases/protein prenyltransferase alpha-alpha toroid n=1 Tax=Parasponia andersonii TaxID=3476 RepID=A0A2P5BA11_PARAD|nr:Terpenoid cyclases/protein prenyltransferase alpha-alpha toroid [Parasponia andersonii]
MWNLKVAEGGQWLITANNHIGRQHWEFDPDAGTSEERARVEKFRQEFKTNRFHSQLRKENPWEPIPPKVKVKEGEQITEKAVTITLKRALSYFSSIQAHDGHWPAELSGMERILQYRINLIAFRRCGTYIVMTQNSG